MSLKYWARIDNPEKYAEINRSLVSHFIEKSLSRTDWDVAKVIYELYKDEYVCVSPKENAWYRFVGHRWEADENGISLRSKISTEVVSEYTRMIAFYNHQSINVSDSDDENSDDDENDENENKYQKKTEILLSITKKLKMSSDKGNFMRECKELFYDKKFYDKLDTKIHLIGFENGVYDLDNEIFRDGSPDDYITLSTNTNYYSQVNDYGILSNEINQIYRFLEQVFPKKEKREYVLKNMASFLHGATADEKFHVFLGEGGNGKTKLVELIILALGEYTRQFNVKLLTGKRKESGQASPDIVGSKGKRFCCLNEPSKGDSMDAGHLKELSGGDMISGRGLYERKMIEFKPQFKLWLLCNHAPKLPPHDDGVWRRMVLLECESKFCKNPNPANKNEFPIDRKLSQKLEQWKEAFLWLLVEYYKIYKRDGLEMPECIKQTTEDYRRSCDAFSDFIEEMITPACQKDTLNQEFCLESTNMVFPANLISV